MLDETKVIHVGPRDKRLYALLFDAEYKRKENPPNKQFIDAFEATDNQIKAMEAGVPEVWSGDGQLRTSAQCKEWAVKIGCNVIFPEEHQLFVDIDGYRTWQHFLTLWPNFQKHFWPCGFRVWPSKSGLPHRHVLVYLGFEDDPRPAALIDRLLMQSILGSDPMRELISLKRLYDKDSNIICFFEPQK